MKSISASIVTLSGCIALAAGAFVSHNDTQMFLMFVGSAVGLIGLLTWWSLVKQPDDKAG